MKLVALPLLVAIVLAGPGCSGPLDGPRASGRVSDWAALLEAPDLAFATGSGRRFRFVIANLFAHEGAGVLHASTIFSGEDAAVQELIAEGVLDVRANGRVHRLRARRLVEAAEIDPLLQTVVFDGLKIEATGARWDPEPARHPGTQVRQWWFRLESEPAS